MTISKDQKSELRGNLRQPADFSGGANQESAADLKNSVIELGDLTSGPDAEVNRLKSRVIAKSVEIDQLRNENIKLAVDCQRLTAELRATKLVLAKFHVKELREVESHSSWPETLNLLQGMFKKSHDGNNNT